MAFVPNPEFWETRRVEGSEYFVCKLCTDGQERTLKSAKSHEATKVHQNARERFRWGKKRRRVEDQDIINDAAISLIHAAAGDTSRPLYPPDHPLVPPHLAHQTSPSPATGLDFHLLDTLGEHELNPSPFQQQLQEIMTSALDFINSDLSENEEVERSDDSEKDSDKEGFGSDGDDDDNAAMTHPTKRPQNYVPDSQTARQWYPWGDRITCTLDILMHLPRSVFSQRQLDLFLWLLRVNGVDHVPSVKTMKALNEKLQKTCGIKTIEYRGMLGNRYYVNSLSQILAQEMANPEVRRHLSFYPEDSGPILSEARQAAKWLHELRAQDTTPMIRVKGEDFFIHEPVMLTDFSLCIPVRWFTRKDKSNRDVFWAKAWPLEVIQEYPGGRGIGWRVREDREFELSQERLLKNLPTLMKDYDVYHLPHPSLLIDVRTKNEPNVVHKWTYTDPQVGNPWRAKANGHKVFSVPLWMYCDDTSGNTSKKWNKHNSFLFTLAGLPREYVSRMYNIHYLCTSNISPPLEMLEGIVEQIQDAQRDGIWAFDCETNEQVLIFPVILALLGDNPMQSEFACHIGLKGKYFCRVCKVKGTDSQASALDPATETPRNSYVGGTESDAPSDHSENASDRDALVPATTRRAASGEKKTQKRTKAVESMANMTTRIRAFLQAGEPRTKGDTIKTLDRLLTLAKEVGKKTAYQAHKTATGVKDTIQDHFIERLFASYKGFQGDVRQERLNQVFSTFPPSITSPIWRLDGLDPHCDTPVEVLHVVLLGFIKYFWRDLIQNELKSKDDKKKLLAQRLSSFDVKGLGFSPLNGNTLVQYAGSLTGQDFRHIAQCAPFVIRDLVPNEKYRAWVALSRLVPLIWQPVIEDIELYLTSLKAEINNFLFCTALWTNRWFNKPKFHILVHLPEHIRRFGPAMLFATESFESFNAVIRTRSIHSNRQAPSRDIAHSFSQANRIRHLLSNGYFYPKRQEGDNGRDDEPIPIQTTNPSDWKCVGNGPRQLAIGGDGTIKDYLGMPLRTEDTQIRHGVCSHANHKRFIPFSETVTAQRLPQQIEAVSFDYQSRKVQTFRSIVLLNGDSCFVGQSVLLHRSPSHKIEIGCVVEIVEEEQGALDGVLVREMEVISNVQTGDLLSNDIHLPRLNAINRWHFVSLKEILCTVNTPHNCIDNKCGPTGTKRLMQERKTTNLDVQFVEHRNNPGDLFLNTFQMRSASYLQTFKLPLPGLALDDVVQRSTAKMFQGKETSFTRTSFRPTSSPGHQPHASTPPRSPMQYSTPGPSSHQVHSPHYYYSSPNQGVFNQHFLSSNIHHPGYTYPLYQTQHPLSHPLSYPPVLAPPSVPFPPSYTSNTTFQRTSNNSFPHSTSKDVD